MNYFKFVLIFFQKISLILSTLVCEIQSIWLEQNIFLGKKNYEIELGKLECPFTWKVEETGHTFIENYHSHDDENFVPLLKLMRNIMLVYFEVKDEKESDQILGHLKNCQKNLTELKESLDPEIPYEAADHILKATECFVYYKLKKKDKLKEVFEKIGCMKSRMRDKKFKSTFLGCKSIAWSKCHGDKTMKDLYFIRRSIELNPKCHLWYFVLGKILRTRRRAINHHCGPSGEEMNCFIKAYQLSRNALYGTYAAQMYRENRDFYSAKMMYLNVLRTDTKNNTLLLRLALGFTRLKNFELAKTCFDILEKDNFTTIVKDNMYLHYKGIFHFNQGSYRTALSFFEKAIKDSNYPCEMNYIRCKLALDKHYDAKYHLLSMLRKYENSPERQIQSILLELAFNYWKVSFQISLTLKYFLMAIEVNPKAAYLTDFFSEIGTKLFTRNIYVVLKEDLLPFIRDTELKLDDDSLKKVQRLKKYCNEHFKSSLYLKS